MEATINLSTLDGANKYLETVFDTARENFELYGYCTPVALVFATIGPEGETFADPAVFIIGAEDDMFEDGRGKDRYAQAVQHVVKASGAVGVAMVQEAWMAEGSVADENIKRMHDGDLAVRDMPDRKEVIMVTMEHFKAKAPIMYRAVITRDSEGKGTLGAFESILGSDSPYAGAKVAGRFTGFLTHIN